MTDTEPVTLQAAIAAAINATLGLLSVFEVFEPQVVGALQIVAGLWIIVIGLLWVRKRVTPNVNVALTVTDEQKLLDAGFQPGNQVP